MPVRVFTTAHRRPALHRPHLAESGAFDFVYSHHTHSVLPWKSTTASGSPMGWATASPPTQRIWRSIGRREPEAGLHPERRLVENGATPLGGRHHGAGPRALVCAAGDDTVHHGRRDAASLKRTRTTSTPWALEGRCKALAPRRPLILPPPVGEPKTRRVAGRTAGRRVELCWSVPMSRPPGTLIPGMCRKRRLSMLTVGVLALQGTCANTLRPSSPAVRGPFSPPPGRAGRTRRAGAAGRESTTIDKLARMFGVAEPLKERIADGFPVYGSCAGLILLAERILDPPRTAGRCPAELRRDRHERAPQCVRPSGRIVRDRPGLRRARVVATTGRRIGRRPARAGARRIHPRPVGRKRRRRRPGPGLRPGPRGDPGTDSGTDSRIVAVRSGIAAGHLLPPEVTGSAGSTNFSSS